MATLGSEFETMKTLLIENLSKQKHLCITTDVWSSRAQSYLGATVHFINTEYIRESYVIGFKYMKGKQTYKELADAVNEIIQNFGINKSQITHIVTDGSSAFCKMFRVYGEEIDATVVSTDIDEIENVDNVDDSNIDRIDTVTPFMEDHGEICISELLDFNPMTNSSNTTQNSRNTYSEYFAVSNTVPNAQKIELPPQRRCVSNLWQKTLKKNYLE